MRPTAVIPSKRTIAMFLVPALVALGLWSSPVSAATIATRAVVSNLSGVAAFTFGPGGRIFYAERVRGRIKIFHPATSTTSLFFSVPDLTTADGGGVLGVELHPDYPNTPFVYVFASRIVGGEARNQVLRLTDSGGTGTDMTVLLSEPALNFHHGGRLLFGPDRRLYTVLGDGRIANAQDLTSNLGKILRMTPRGTVPADNPFPNSLIFAYGIRNSFGFTFDPATGSLWETENGPACNDELNRIRAGRNYGWGPSETCESPPRPPLNTNQDGPDPVLPHFWYTPQIAPTGAAFCTSCRLGPASAGRLFFGAYNTGELRRVTLNDTRTRAISQAVVYTHPRQILAIEVAPTGRLYISDGTAIRRLVFS